MGVSPGLPAAAEMHWPRRQVRRRGGAPAIQNSSKFWKRNYSSELSQLSERLIDCAAWFAEGLAGLIRLNPTQRAAHSSTLRQRSICRNHVIRRPPLSLSSIARSNGVRSRSRRLPGGCSSQRGVQSEPLGDSPRIGRCDQLLLGVTRRGRTAPRLAAGQLNWMIGRLGHRAARQQFRNSIENPG